MSTIKARHAVALRALVVDDNRINRMVLTRILEFRGIVVEVAKNGREAVERIAGELFDVVLMDVQMPEMDGIAAILAIRELELVAGRRTPIVVVTALDGVEERQMCADAGADEFLVKPVSPSVLFEALEAVGMGYNPRSM